MTEAKYCPNCVSEMVREKKKLGNNTKWFKCKSCGVREEDVDEYLVELRENARLKAVQKKIDERGYYDEEGYNTY